MRLRMGILHQVQSRSGSCCPVSGDGGEVLISVGSIVKNQEGVCQCIEHFNSSLGLWRS